MGKWLNGLRVKIVDRENEEKGKVEMRKCGMWNDESPKVFLAYRDPGEGKVGTNYKFAPAG